MSFKIVRNDITRVKADAIVNTANPHPVIGEGVDSAIHRKAGPGLLEERKKIGDIAPGSAALTPAFHLAAKFVIHTVGPVWCGGTAREAETLAACYRNSLALAAKATCKSIAFPLISTGTYGFPKDLALQVAVREIGTFVLANEMDVTLVVFDRASYELSEKLSDGVHSFLDENYVSRRLKDTDEERAQQVRRFQMAQAAASMAVPRNFEKLVCREPVAAYRIEPASRTPQHGLEEKKSLDELLARTDEPFTKTLFRLIAARHLLDPDVYKRANIDRKLFSKIRSDPEYKPRKGTCLALAIALKLTMEETRDLIGRAGYLLTHSNKRDIVVEYFIERGEYNIFQINQVLFSLRLPLIGT